MKATSKNLEHFRLIYTLITVKKTVMMSEVGSLNSTTRSLNQKKRFYVRTYCNKVWNRIITFIPDRISFYEARHWLSWRNLQDLLNPPFDEEEEDFILISFFFLA